MLFRKWNMLKPGTFANHPNWGHHPNHKPSDRERGSRPQMRVHNCELFGRWTHSIYMSFNHYFCTCIYFSCEHQGFLSSIIHQKLFFFVSNSSLLVVHLKPLWFITLLQDLQTPWNLQGPRTLQIFKLGPWTHQVFLGRDPFQSHEPFILGHDHHSASHF